MEDGQAYAAYMGERKAYGAIGCSEGILDRVENQTGVFTRASARC